MMRGDSARTRQRDTSPLSSRATRAAPYLRSRPRLLIASSLHETREAIVDSVLSHGKGIGRNKVTSRFMRVGGEIAAVDQGGGASGIASSDMWVGGCDTEGSSERSRVLAWIGAVYLCEVPFYLYFTVPRDCALPTRVTFPFSVTSNTQVANQSAHAELATAAIDDR